MNPDLTIGAVVANAALGGPDATAAVIGDEPIAFAQLDSAGTNVAHRLMAGGLQSGDVALVFGATSFEMLAHFVGCARAGVVFAPLNPALDAATLRGVVADIAPAVVLASPECHTIAADLGVPQRWESTDPIEPAPALPYFDSTHPHIAFFTSGSTGAPKAALLSHQTSVLRSHPGSQLEPRGPALCPYPLFHMAGWTISLQQWHARAPVVFVDGTDAATLADALRTHHIERFNAIPALWSRLADYLGAQPHDAATLPHLRFADTGTSPTSVELLASITRMAPRAHVRVFYGSTEAGNVASLHHDDLLSKPGSCGRPSVLTTVRIGDDDELLVAGPLLFDGYLADPEATAAALRDGWYHTGDRAELDAEGYLSIVGRLGTVIRSGGESIVPATVEAAVLEHPDIDEVAVFGIPDERWGEIVGAAVVATTALTLDDLNTHLADQPKHIRPRLLLRLDAIPRTAATGQVDRHRLRQLADEHTDPTDPNAGPNR